MKRSEAIEAATVAELRACAGQFDGDWPLDTVTIIVQLTRDGRVKGRVVRTEGRRDLGPAERGRVA